MKKIIFLFSILIVAQIAHCQDITGTWNGVLDIQTLKFHIVFHISKSADGYTATMDSPDQGAKGLAVEKVEFDNSKLTISIPAFRIEYKGELIDNEAIKGTFTQGGMPFVLNLSRGEVVQKRPQTPQPPFPYKTEEVSFANQTDGRIVLSGTLTLPEGVGKFPAVVLVSGSGAQNRDEELFEHKPFFVLADYLTRRGIAVLRYDDRGTAKSTGNFSTATTYDFSVDAESAFNFLKNHKNISPKQIGIIGHSEGGVVAPMIAARNADVAFIISLAGSSIAGDSLLLMQQKAIFTAMNLPKEELQKAHDTNKTLFEMVKNTTDSAQLRAELVKYLENALKDETDAASKNNADAALAQLDNAWMKFFIRYNPADAWEKVRCPVLALNGEKDLQVPYNENLTAIKTALEKGGNKKFTIKSIPALNHLFQPSTSGLPSEYGQIETTISEEVLKIIAEWIWAKK